MSPTTLSAEWQCYAECSRRTHFGRIDSITAGREEQCDCILDWIARGIKFACPKRDKKNVDKLRFMPWNRSKKHRRLGRELWLRQAALTRQVGQMVGDTGLDSAALDRLDPEHLSVEVRLVEGHSYRELAAVMGMSEGSLKMRVSRWRQQARATINFS